MLEQDLAQSGYLRSDGDDDDDDDPEFLVTPSPALFLTPHRSLPIKHQPLFLNQCRSTSQPILLPGKTDAESHYQSSTKWAFPTPEWDCNATEVHGTWLVSYIRFAEFPVG